MPTPSSDESRDDFISRCIPIVIKDGTAKSQEQAVAVCNSMWRRNMRNVGRYVRMTGLADSSQLRTASFDGVEHIVVPVVALVGDSVVQGLNALGPEFVPAQELAVAPKSWNGRPVVPDHPNGGLSSANEPEILETQSFGRMFNTRFEDDRLKTEAWLDPLRAQRVGSDAVRVIERCNAGEMVEVSVGAWISIDNTPGMTEDGVSYQARWRDIVPDHLAMLPEGVKGACSAEMGCGAPRVNRKGDTMPWQLDTLDVSDDNVTLRVSRKGTQSVTGEGTQSVTGEAEADMAPDATPDVPEVDGPHDEDETTSTGLTAQGDNMSKIDELIERLVANEASPFEKEDKDVLSAFSEERLEAMCGCLTQAESAEDVDATAPDIPEGEPAPVTEEEWMEAAPESLRAMVRKYRAEEKRRRTNLISALRSAQSAYTVEQLEAKDTDDLEALSRALKLDEDYSGRGLPSHGYDPGANLPDAYGLYGKSN